MRARCGWPVGRARCGWPAGLLVLPPLQSRACAQRGTAARPPPPVNHPPTATPASPPTPTRALGYALLLLLHSTLTDLFLDDGLRYEAFGEFMEAVAASDAIAASPSAFLAYLAVLTALAAGEKGARSMYLQVR